MKLLVITLALQLAQAAPAFAQDRSADERAIREEIAQINAGRRTDVGTTDDMVFWSGAYVRPVIGNEEPEIRPGSSAGGKRTNIKTNIKVVQLRVSQSGDMAYEYSTVQNTWDRTDDKRHIEFEAAVLRVWRKVNGQWRVAASFQRPIENTPSER